MEKMDITLPLKVTGEKFEDVFFMAIILLFFVSLLFLAKSAGIFIIVLLLLAIFFFILGKGIRYVLFEENHIMIYYYMHRKGKQIEYGQLKKFHDANNYSYKTQGVYIIEFKKEGSKRLKKFAFYHPDLDYLEFKDFLLSTAKSKCWVRG